jgi:hypothetical protein
MVVSCMTMVLMQDCRIRQMKLISSLHFAASIDDHYLFLLDILFEVNLVVSFHAISVVVEPTHSSRVDRPVSNHAQNVSIHVLELPGGFKNRHGFRLKQKVDSSILEGKDEVSNHQLLSVGFDAILLVDGFNKVGQGDLRLVVSLPCLVPRNYGPVLENAADIV